MKLRKFFLILGALLFFATVFIINAVTKNFDLEQSILLHVRSACVIASFLLVYSYLQIKKREQQLSVVKHVSAAAVVTGLFLLLYLIISFLPIKGFETKEYKLFPADYLTIFFSSILSIAAGLFSLTTIILVKDLLLYKRKKNTTRNFWILFILIIVASLSSLAQRPLETSSLTGILTGITILLIILNSFRLSWIAYLPRKEKIQVLFYSVLAFFGFLVVSIIISNQEDWTQKGIHYYSPSLFTFVLLSSILGAIYFGMAFISTLFHLPTAEAFDRKQTEISSLHNLGKLINQVFDLRDLGETATKMAAEVVQASSVWLEIAAMEQGKQTMERMSSFNISDQDIQTIVSDTGKSIRDTVLQSKKVLIIDDVVNDKRMNLGTTNKNVGSMLVLPLLSHDSVIGILFATKEMTYGFDQDDADILSGFGDQVSIAIENARLIKKSFEKERLQRELMLAQEMQKRLLPQSLPQFATVEMQAVSSPALEVGGDYYDVVQVDDDRVGVVIGDVSGKGVGAAFYMAEVKGIFQSLSKIYKSPKEFLVKANEALVSSIDKRSFISLIYSTINIRTGELIMSRAGHCPILYISRAKKEYIKPVGLGLGLKSGKIFEETIEEKKIFMNNGDVCVFYTDGVTESRSPDGEEFGYERLLDIVDANKQRSAEEIKEAIVQTVWEYTDEQGYHDDLTVFVVKWIGK